MGPQENKQLVCNADALRVARAVLVREYLALGEAIKTLDTLLRCGQAVEERDADENNLGNSVRPVGGG
jgi:hypothetical protein